LLWLHVPANVAWVKVTATSVKAVVSENPEFDEFCMERVAVGIQLALLPDVLEPLPAGLHARIKSDAPRHLARFQLNRAIPQSGRDHR
jgi:hypothetical protein